MRGRGSGARHSRPLFLHDEQLGLIRSQRIFLVRQLEHELSPRVCANIPLLGSICVTSGTVFASVRMGVDRIESPDLNGRGAGGVKIA